MIMHTSLARKHEDLIEDMEIAHRESNYLPNNYTQKGPDQAEKITSVVFPSEFQAPEGFIDATCETISCVKQCPPNLSDGSTFDNKGYPYYIIAEFEYYHKASDGVLVRRICRKYDQGTSEGKAGLHSLARNLLGETVSGDFELKKLEGKPCVLLIIHREVRGDVYSVVFDVLPPSQIEVSV